MGGILVCAYNADSGGGVQDYEKHADIYSIAPNQHVIPGRAEFPVELGKIIRACLFGIAAASPWQSLKAKKNLIPEPVIYVQFSTGLAGRHDLN